MENKELNESGTILALKEQSNEIRNLHRALFFCGTIGALSLIFVLILVYYIASTDVVGHYIYTFKSGGC